MNRELSYTEVGVSSRQSFIVEGQGSYGTKGWRYGNMYDKEDIDCRKKRKR